jgi:hypothetical protein
VQHSLRAIAGALILIVAGCASSPAAAVAPETFQAAAAHRTHLASNMLIFATDSGELR